MRRIEVIAVTKTSDIMRIADTAGFV